VKRLEHDKEDDEKDEDEARSAAGWLSPRLTKAVPSLD
jgi:hypothetical protein